MKRTLLLLLSLLFPVLALAQEEPALQPGSVLCGFRLSEVRQSDYLDSTIYLFEHEKTGAPVVYIANDDTDRAFQIAFNTRVNNDKGTPHVFEHACLSGSEKYPDPNLTFSMMYGTYNTYMNARTFKHLTEFPTSSLSEEQLLVDMDVYLDGVFHPLVMTDEHSMMREAYRYELTDADAELTLQGTVYSEMLGAMTHSRYNTLQLNRLLYPGSSYASETGGLPDVIPELTLQELRDFHDLYYVPSNALVVLYGDLHIERFLALLDDGYFSHYEKTAVDLAEKTARKLEGHIQAHYTFPVSSDAENETIVSYAIPLQPVSLQDDLLVAIACNILSAPDHLMDRRMNAELPDVIWGLSTDHSITGTTLLFSALGIEESEVSLFCEICDAACKDLMTNGLSRADVQDYVDAERFTNALKGETSGGLSVAESTAYYWSLTGDPLAMLSYSYYMEHLEAVAEQDLATAAFRAAYGEPDASVTVITTTLPGGKEAQEKRRVQQLAEKKAAMSQEEIDALVEKTREYYAWSDACAENSLLSSVTAVTPADLPEEIRTAESAEEAFDDLTVYSSAVEDTDFISISYALDLADVPGSMLLPLAHMVDELMEILPTQQHTREVIMHLNTRLCNGLSIRLTWLENDLTGWWRPVLLISWQTFDDLVEESFAFVTECLLQTDLSDLNYIRSTVSSSAQSLRHTATSSTPYSIALSEFWRHILDSAAWASQFNGLRKIEYYEKLAGMDDEALQAEIDRARLALAAAFSGKAPTATVVGSGPSIAHTVPLLRQLTAALRENAAAPDEPAVLPEWREGDTALLFTSNVSYNLEGLPLKDLGLEYDARLDVFSRLAADKVLIPVLRYQNSVYSVFFQFSPEACFLLTYRDPSLSKTYGGIFPSLGGILKDALKGISQTDLNSYINAVYSDYSGYVGPISAAETAVSDRLTGMNSFEYSRQMMDSLKQMTIDDLAAYADILDTLSEKGLKVTATGPQMLEECPELFTHVDKGYLTR